MCGAADTVIPGFIARVEWAQNTPNGLVKLSTTARWTHDTTTGAKTLRAGGAWKGPRLSLNNLFPWATNTSGIGNLGAAFDKPARVNMKNDQTYDVTAQLVIIAIEPAVIQGYANTPGDGALSYANRATVTDSGGAFGTPMWSHQTDGDYMVADMIFMCTKANVAGNSTVLVAAGSSHYYLRCSFVNAAGFGTTNGSRNTFEECEWYNCNRSNTLGDGCAEVNIDTMFTRCYFHDCNSGSNANAIVRGSNSLQGQVQGCVFDNISGAAIADVNTGAVGGARLINCDFFRCGIVFKVATGAGPTTQLFFTAQNCNFLGCGTILYNGPNVRVQGIWKNNGYGSGIYRNSREYVNASCIELDDIQGNNSRIVYPPDTTPWSSPTTGDFRIIGSEAVGAGRGIFTQTQGSKTGTIGYPDIGAAQSNAITTGWANMEMYLPDGFVNHSYVVLWIFGVATALELVTGALPPGLSLTQLDETHVTISGIPTTVGFYTFVLREIVGTATGDATFHITILPDPGDLPLIWGDFEMPDAYVNQPYEFEWFLENVTFPVTYSLISGTLPAGLLVNSLGVESHGKLSGTPATQRRYIFVLRATNADGTADKEFIVNVLPDPSGGGSNGYIFGN